MFKSRFVWACAAVTLGLSSRAAEPGIPPQAAMVNDLIAGKWKEADIKKPAARSTDLEFARRVFLDLVGRIPTAEEVIDFEQDKSSDKRRKLINRLLTNADFRPRNAGRPVQLDAKTQLKFDYTDEYADHWANLWTIWLMSRSVEPRYREQMRVWLQTEFLKETNHRDMVSQVLTATGKGNENGAVNFIALQLGEKNPNDKQNELGTFDGVPITSRVTRVFLGLQTQCTQCHDHPFNKEWVQSDFWGVNAFFRQISREGTPTPNVRLNRGMMAPLVQLTIGEDAKKNVEGRIYYERRDGQMKMAKPTFLKDVAQADKGEKSDKFLDTMPDAKTRREALAQFVVGHDNFAKAYVNRIWGHLFGRGLNKEPSLDDFGSHNEVIHPEMLDKLAGDFAKYGYNPKLLLEWICNSDVYQLSHVGVKDYTDPKYDVYFARMPLKAMSPEVLFESISTATRADMAKAVDPKQRQASRDAWLEKLIQQFGDDEGNELTFNGTIVQALLMMNGKEINDEVGTKGANAVLRVVEKHAKTGSVNAVGIIDDLFLMTLSRHPTAEELTKIRTIQQKGAIIPRDPKDAPKTVAPTTPAKGANPPKGKGPNRLAAAPAIPGIVQPTLPNDVTFYQDLFWALLNTNEFMLNH